MKQISTEKESGGTQDRGLIRRKVEGDAEVSDTKKATENSVLL